MNEFKKQDQGKTEDKSAFGQLNEKGQQQQGEFGKEKKSEFEGATGGKEFDKQQQQQDQTRAQQGDRTPSDKGGQQG